MIDIDALEALAKAATPGPWTVDEECLTDRGCLYVAKGKPGDLRGRVLEVFKNCLVRDAGRASNAEFIAAANPTSILDLVAEVRALREDAGDWKRRWQDAVDRASALTIERNHWQSNHDNQVSRARFLIERSDLPIERVRAYQTFGALLALEEAVRAQRAMYEGTSDEDNMSALSIGDAIAKLDAARKEKSC